MRLQRFSCLLAVLSTSARAADKDPYNNEDKVGPSKHYKELTNENLVAYTNTSTEMVLILYSDRCQHCQEIHPQQEATAEAVLREYPRKKHWDSLTKELSLDYTHVGVKFARYDVYLWGGAAGGKIMHKILSDEEKGNPSWAEGSGVSAGDELSPPQAYLFGPHMSWSKRIPHGEIGWGAEGTKTFRKWLRANLNNGKGYVHKKKQKKKALGKEYLDEEKAVDKANGPRKTDFSEL